MEVVEVLGWWIYFECRVKKIPDGFSERCEREISTDPRFFGLSN